jgi:hypothetical protein
MTFSAFAGEFEEVCQRHDAFVEQGRRELMAEQLHGNEGTGQPGSIERDIRDLDQAQISIES